MNQVKDVIKTVFSTIRTAPTFTKLNKVWYGSDSPIKHTEKSIERVLKDKFKEATEIKVMDISGGCGAMFDIYIESSKFKGLPIVRQHRLVNKALENQIKDMHGLRITTMTPKK